MTVPGLEIHADRHWKLSVLGVLLAPLVAMILHGGNALGQEAELTAPAQVSPNDEVSVPWRGPDAPGDFIAVADPEAPAASFHAYARTSAGNPARLAAPEAGEYELRYISGAGLAVLARVPLRVGAAAGGAATLTAPDQVSPGGEVAVQWRGPDAPGDFVAIADPEAPAASFHAYARTSAGNPARLAAPEAGKYELRYISGAGLGVLARVALRVEAGGATGALSAPAEIEAQAELTVDVAEPGDPADYVTIVPVGAPDHAFGPYARLGGETQMILEAPDTAGRYEIRHIRAAGPSVLARAPLLVTAPPPVAATGEAPDQATPDNKDNESVSAIQPSDAPEDAPTTARAPSGAIELMALVAVDRGRDFRIAWEGPGADGDWIGVVPAGRGADDTVGSVAVSGGSPVGMTAPGTPGSYEIIYVAGDGTVLGLRALEVR